MAQPDLQEVVDTARLTLNDADKDRWPDADGLKYMRDGVGVMLDKRPDLFIGQYATLDLSALTLASPLPCNERYLPVLVDYLIFRANRNEGEFSQNGHALASLKFFEGRL